MSCNSLNIFVSFSYLQAYEKKVMQKQGIILRMKQTTEDIKRCLDDLPYQQL